MHGHFEHRKSRTLRTVRVGISLVLATISLNFSVPAQQATHNFSPEQESYRAELANLWNSAKNDPSISRIKNLAAQLSLPELKDQAMADLKKQTEISMKVLYPDDPLKGWKKYVAAIEKTVLGNEEIIIKDMSDIVARRVAISFLGEEAPQKAFLPLLRKIASSPHEPDSIRSRALRSIAQVPHPEVVTDLIEFLDDARLGFGAWELLSSLTHAEIAFRREDRARTRLEYEHWWQENKTDFTYKRAATLLEY